MNDPEWLIIAGTIGPVITLSSILLVVRYVRKREKVFRDRLKQYDENITGLASLIQDLHQRVRELEEAVTRPEEGNT